MTQKIDITEILIDHFDHLAEKYGAGHVKTVGSKLIYWVVDDEVR